MDDFKTKKIFLIDALGAAVSVIGLYLLYSFHKLFGIPQSTLIIFMCIASVFSSYSFICYFVKLSNWRLNLFIISIFNISYCLFTIYHIFQNSSRITFLGYLYFVLEILVVLMLSFYEFQLSRKKNNYFSI